MPELDDIDKTKSPADVVRHWFAALNVADKEEASWRKTAQDIYDKYLSKKCKDASYNILWANTELLRPAIYNTLPQPAARRRFNDEDPLGKAVSDVINRSLEFSFDIPEFDRSVKFTVLDSLLCGRGVARVRYVPSFSQYGEGEAEGATYEAEEATIENEEQEAEYAEGYSEELEWEQTTLEHVQWNDFRRGPGKCWEEVEWVAFRHCMTREELIDKFGEEKANQVSMTDPKDIQTSDKAEEDKLKAAFSTATVWELWDREEKEVLFLNDSYRNEPLLTVSDPLNLEGFFPLPCPLYVVEDSTSLVPTPLFSLYAEQAKELNRISERINKIIDACKVRGIYDSRLSELSELFRGNDTDLIPAQNVAALQNADFNKIIWFAPIEQMVAVTQVLYNQREQCKQVIYELTGISDILRGSSDPNETLGAQQIKAQFGSARLQRMQREVQRFIRDCARLMAEIIGEKFKVETLRAITQLPFPTDEEVAMMNMQYQAQAQAAQMQGQQPPPPPEQPEITWGMVIDALRSNSQRTFKVDIETDSTIAATQEDDIQSLTKLLAGITEFINGMAPAVQSGAVPIEAVKELILAMCRRAKMGTVVEDALNKIQQPQQPQNNEAEAEQQKLQMEMQAKQMESQQELALKDKEAQKEIQIEQMRIQADLQKEQMRIAADKEQFLLKLAADRELEQLRLASQPVNVNQ